MFSEIGNVRKRDREFADKARQSAMCASALGRLRKLSARQLRIRPGNRQCVKRSWEVEQLRRLRKLSAQSAHSQLSTVNSQLKEVLF